MPDEHHDRTLTCVFCGHAYPPGTPTHGADVLKQHVVQCPAHPMSEAVEILFTAILTGALTDSPTLKARAVAYLRQIGRLKD